MQGHRFTTAVALPALLALAPHACTAASTTAKPAVASLRAGQEGTAFGNLTVEGEDRVHFEIERPALDLAIDPTRAPGLDWGDAHDVLDRTVPDAAAPLAQASGRSLPRYLGRPWLRTFAHGDVVRIRPQVENVESWRLLIADARGQVVATFTGKSKPPAELTWDGRTADGGLAVPGLTYSFVLEARDRAGNKRNFVGDGFLLPAYRIDGREGPVFAFPGNGKPLQLAAAAPVAANAADDLAPFVLEVASEMNQAPAQRPVHVVVAARSATQARELGDRVTRLLAPELLGGAARIHVQARVEADTTPAGTIQISSAP